MGNVPSALIINANIYVINVDVYVMPVLTTDLFHIALKSDGFADNADRFKLFIEVYHIFVSRIFGVKNKHISFGVIIDALQGGFVINDYCGDLAVINGGLLTDKNDITVFYPRSDHAVAFAF